MAVFEKDYEALLSWSADIDPIKKSYLELPKGLRDNFAERFADTTSPMEMMGPYSALRQLQVACEFFIEADQEGEMDYLIDSEL